jgi:exodeoxyribonuclease-1
MANSFYFYDLETSGINPQQARVMQFAGQRVDLDLNSLGEPHNILIAMSEDVLPDPEAILVTGITPQQTLDEGVTEVEFMKIFDEEIATPGTIMVGYNSIRFDDTFMRFMRYRNFYDAYSWQWKDDRSKWDLLDVVRMTRALRPDGIIWPVDESGKATNRLEILTAQNGLDHMKAHDALSDVLATIALATLLREKQPKLFDYLLSIREKKAVSSLILGNEPYVYTAGRISSEFNKTSVVRTIAEVKQKGSVLVYDLRIDPEPLLHLSEEEILEAWQWKAPAERTENDIKLPILEIALNQCPAVAPLATLDESSQERIQLDLKTIAKNRKKLSSATDFLNRVVSAHSKRTQQQSQYFTTKSTDVDGKLYDGFIGTDDQRVMQNVRMADPDALPGFMTRFKDKRLQQLLPLYKARNFPKSLTDEERTQWEEYKNKKLFEGGDKSQLAQYFMKLQEIASRPNISTAQQHVLEDLQLYGQSLMPTD